MGTATPPPGTVASRETAKRRGAEGGGGLLLGGVSRSGAGAGGVFNGERFATSIFFGGSWGTGGTGGGSATGGRESTSVTRVGGGRLASRRTGGASQTQAKNAA